MSWTFIPGASGIATFPLSGGSVAYSRQSYPDWDQVLSHDLDMDSYTTILDGADGLARHVAWYNSELYCCFSEGINLNDRIVVQKYSGTGTSWSTVFDHTPANNGAAYADEVYLMTQGDQLVVIWGTTGDDDARHGLAYSANGSSWTVGGYDGADDDPISIVPLSVSDRQSQLSYVVTNWDSSAGTPDPCGVYNPGSGDLSEVSDKFLSQDVLYYWRVSGGNVEYSTSPYSGWTVANTHAVGSPAPIYVDGPNVPCAVYKSGSSMYFCYWDTEAGDWSAGEVIGSAGAITDPYDLAGMVFNCQGDTYIYANFGSGFGQRLFRRGSLLEFDPPDPGGAPDFSLTHSAGGIPGAIRVLS